MRLQDILTYARIKPAVHQIEVHPVWTNQYNINFCHKEVSIIFPHRHFHIGVLGHCIVYGVILFSRQHAQKNEIMSACCG
jgi:hypothetical protein